MSEGNEMAYDLSNKVVLITGGAGGIGFSVVQELLRNGLKAATITDISESNGKSALNKLTTEFGTNKAIFVKADVTEIDQLQDVFQRSLDNWGTIDIVINNAGIMNDGQWERELSLNCGAVVQGTFLGMEYMGKNNGGGGGIIVNVASLLGLRPHTFLPVYTGTKHFVIGFSRALGTSYHYNRTGVKVLTICPGITNTPLLTESVKAPLNIAPEVSRELTQVINGRLLQSANHVARALITVITEGQNGSVWVVDNGEPAYEFQLPNHEKLAD